MITQLALAARQEELARCTNRLVTLADNKKKREEELMRVQLGLETCPGTTEFRRKWLVRQKTRVTILQAEIEFYARRITLEEKEMAEHTQAIDQYEQKLEPSVANVPRQPLKTLSLIGGERKMKRHRSCRGKKYKNKPREPRKPKPPKNKKNTAQKPKKAVAKGKKQGQNLKAA